MQVTVLGSGSAIQYENRASASFLLEAGARKIVLDAGFYLLDRLEKAGVRADEIDAVYISHKHPDHFFGLLHLLFALKNKYYTPKDKLLIIGFKGLTKWMESFREILGRWIEPDMQIEICDDTKGSFEGFRWELFNTVHSPESTGIVITYDEKRVVYTGDTEYFEGLCEISAGADLLIAECGSGNNEKTKGHMSLKEIELLAEKSEATKILLTHIYPETDKTPEKWVKSKSELMRSYDLQRISL